MQTDTPHPHKITRHPYKPLTLSDFITEVMHTLQAFPCACDGEQSNASRAIAWWSKDRDFRKILNRSNTLDTVLLPKGAGHYFVSCADEGTDGYAIRIIMMDTTTGQSIILMTIAYRLEPMTVWKIADTLQKALDL